MWHNAAMATSFLNQDLERLAQLKQGVNICIKFKIIIVLIKTVSHQLEKPIKYKLYVLLNNWKLGMKLGKLGNAYKIHHQVMHCLFL